MPTIAELPFDSKFISLSAERDAIRSPGIHLSSIIKDMLITAGIQKIRESKFSSDQQNLVFEQGFLWENMITEVINSKEYQQYEIDKLAELGLKGLIDDEVVASKGAVIRPGEQQLDGIYLTPDAINTRLWHYEEWKATSIRSAKFDIASRKPQWLWQGAANCKVFGMTRTVFRVWHSGELPQTIKQWVVDWSTQEIEDNWKMILDHYEVMKGRLKT